MKKMQELRRVQHHALITSKEHQDYMDIKLFIRINELPFHFKSK
jgi:hypothetical protein